MPLLLPAIGRRQRPGAGWERLKMKHLTHVVVFLFLMAAAFVPAAPAAAQQPGAEGMQTEQGPDFFRGAGQACAFGAAVLGVTALLVVYPAAISGSASLPWGSILLSNVLFGCGIAAVGSAAAYGFSSFYDSFAG